MDRFVTSFAYAISVVITFATIFALVNFRWLRLPTTIGTMALSLVSTTILSLLGRRSQACNSSPPISFHGSTSMRSYLYRRCLLGPGAGADDGAAVAAPWPGLPDSVSR